MHRSIANWFVLEIPVQRHATSSVIGHEITTGTVTGRRGFGRSRRSSRHGDGSTCTGNASGLIPETTDDVIVARDAGAGRRLVRLTLMGRGSCFYAGVHHTGACFG